MTNKYDLLDASELNQFVYSILSMNEKARYSFFKDLLDNISPKKYDLALDALFDNDAFNDILPLEKDLYLSFIQKIFDSNTTRYIYNNFSECHEEFLQLIVQSEKLLTQCFNAILLEDKKDFPVFNSMMAEIVDNTALIHNPTFKKLIFSTQDKLQASVLKEIILESKEPLKIYSEFNDSSKERLHQSSELNKILNHFILFSKKQDKLKPIFEQYNLLDKINANQIVFCIKHNKKSVVNELFSKKDINQQLQLGFWDVVIVNADKDDKKENYFNYLKQHLSQTEIAKALKSVIKTESSFTNFYRLQINAKKLPIQAMVNIIEAFEEELKTYLKINPIKLLENFVASNEKRIKKDMYGHIYSSDEVNKQYNNLLIDLQKKTLERVVQVVEKNKTNKLKI